MMSIRKVINEVHGASTWCLTRILEKLLQNEKLFHNWENTIVCINVEEEREKNQTSELKIVSLCL